MADQDCLGFFPPKGREKLPWTIFNFLICFPWGIIFGVNQVPLLTPPKTNMWNLKMTILKRKIIFQTFNFGFHGTFRGVFFVCQKTGIPFPKVFGTSLPNTTAARRFRLWDLRQWSTPIPIRTVFHVSKLVVINGEWKALGVWNSVIRNGWINVNEPSSNLT